MVYTLDNDDRPYRQELRDATKQRKIATLRSICFDVFSLVDVICHALESDDIAIARSQTQLAREASRLFVISSTPEFIYYTRLDNMLRDAVQVRPIKRNTALQPLPATSSDVATALLQCITFVEDKLGTYIHRNKKKGVIVYKELNGKNQKGLTKKGLPEGKYIRRKED